MRAVPTRYPRGGNGTRIGEATSGMELGTAPEVDLRQRLQANAEATDFAKRQLAELSAGSSRTECDAVIVCLHKLPNSALAEAAGVTTGTTGGIIVDERMRTSKDGVWAAGDVIEVPHGLSMIPIRGLTGSHAMQPRHASK